MYSDVSQQNSSSALASTRRSLFSRLTAPLRSRTRNLTDFHIRPLEPHRRYSPGDIVKGIVVLTVVKPIRITHLTVALHGFVSVYKNATALGEAPPVEPAIVQTETSTKARYFGNGYASLFHDEITLCGEGRLEPGVYEFEFNIEFPEKGLPTSIDFERGTISYMLRSTLTRPTSIAATSTCDRKVALVETVDIGPMLIPKPRIISLEPIPKRPRKRLRPVTTIEQPNPDPANISDAPKSSESPLPDESASQQGNTDHGPASPRSPIHSDIQSEISEDSAVSSSSTGISYRIGPTPSSKSGSNSQETNNSTTIKNKTITAKMELLKGGCLPGDTIPIKISIQHTKRIKSLHGIIITLYRQGRIDTAPPLSLFADIKGKEAERLKHEEYYPKSKTGLGGLSLVSAGSTSVFRKDLSQTLAPIMIDPVTLSTVVTASLRVPEDVFPTITGVPGEMISFRYYIEVVIDLGGKLAGQDRHLPRLGGLVSLPSMTNHSGQMLGKDTGSGTMLAAWGGNIVNTDRVRREKSVVACLFEITVGTTDSARKRRRGVALDTKIPETGSGDPLSQMLSTDHESQHEPCYESIPVEPSGPYNEYDHRQADWQHGMDGEPYPYDHEYIGEVEHGQTPMYAHVPPPEEIRDENLTEKERILKAEQRLLPSRPPLRESSSSQPLTPSAPPDLGDLYGAHDHPPPQPPYTLTAPRTQADELYTTANEYSAPSAPALEDLEPAPNPETEDKQELERRRLQAEASSPADFPDIDDNAGEGSAPRLQQEPTAPILTEEDDYGGHYSGPAFPAPSEHHDGLPRYER